MEIPNTIEISQQQKALVARIGEVDLSNREISSFTQIEIPEIATSLNLSNNYIAEFAGFIPEPSLETLILDDNPIVTFRNFPENNNIRHFSALRAPITLLPNFRFLTLLAIGDGLESINGVDVTLNEKAAVSGQKLFDFFSRKAITKGSENEYKEIKNLMSSLLKQGWIGDSLPRNLTSAEKKAEEAESDPITVLGVRLFNIVHSDEETMILFFRQHMSPSHKIIIAPPRIDEKLEQQQNLIAFMQDQLNELKKEHQDQVQKLQKTTTYKSKVQREKELEELEESTLNAYNEVVRRAAPELIENSRIILEEEKKKGRKNPKGLRTVAAKILGVDPNIGDRELAKMLRELSSTA